MVHSTRHGSIPLASVTSGQVERVLGLDAKAARQRLDARKQQHGDPAAVERALHGLPAPTVAVLSLVVEEGGVIPFDLLVERARSRYRLTLEQVRVATAPAVQELLLLPATTHTGAAYAVTSPADMALAALLTTLDVEPLADAPFVPSPDAAGGRAFLAACMALAHADAKLTNEGRPHRAAVKRLGKQLGLGDDLLERLLVAGLAFNALRPDADRVLRPHVDTLRAMAELDYRAFPIVEAILSRARRAPQPIALVARWLRATVWSYVYAGVDEVAHLPGLRGGTVAGIGAIADAPQAGVPSGHVTPSFEVLIPPEAPLVDIVDVLACSEPTRIDRMIVARLTKASVTRAAAAGFDEARVLAILTRASRTPIPQNVESTVRDWLANATVATVTTAQIVQVPAAATERVHAALAAFAPRLLAPGVLAIPVEVTPRELTAALEHAGVRAHVDVAQDDDVNDRDPELAAMQFAAPRDLTPDRLRARVAAWRRGAPFEGRADDFLATHRLVEAPATPTPRPPPPPRFEIADDIDPLESLRDSLAEAELAEWEQRRGCVLPDRAFPELVHRLAQGRAPEARHAILMDCRTVPELYRALGVTVRNGKVHTLAPDAPSTAPTPAPVVPTDAVWRRDDIHGHLVRAEAAGRTCAIDTGTATMCVDEVRVIRRGNAWLLLGEDRGAQLSIALPLPTIRAVAILPRASAPPARGPWRPAEGQPAPPGHAPCPCGSGQRYRACCRAATSPAG